MAKKETDDLEKDLFSFNEDDDKDKKLSGDQSDSGTVGSGDSETDPSSLEMADRLDNLLESEEVVKKDFKYLQLAVIKQTDVEYLVVIKHQSHGFLNYMVSKVLKVKGVQFAAYKITTLEDPRIIIHLDGSKDIKTVLKDTISKMRIELKGIGNAIESISL